MSREEGTPSHSFMHRVDAIQDSLVTNMQKPIIKEFLAEFIGTFILILVGDSAIASYVLAKGTVDTMAVCFSWGVGAMIGITASANISGGHINPAVTVTQAVMGNFPWKKVPHYVLAQYLGAFFASATVFLLYHDAINNYNTNSSLVFQETGFIWATQPKEYVTLTGAFVDQVIGTAVLLFAVLTTGNPKGINFKDHAGPIYMAMVITVCCIAFGLNCMAILNPARDLAPRLFLVLAGYGSAPFELLGGHYWWVAGLVGPHVGGIIGAFLYYVFIDASKFTRASVDVTEQEDLELRQELKVVSTSAKSPLAEPKAT